MTGPAPPVSGAQEDRPVTREEEEERLHFHKVRNAFGTYRKHGLAAVHRREEYLARLPADHQALLRRHGYQATLDDLKVALDQNHTIIKAVLADVEDMFENVSHESKAEADPRVRPAQMDMEKVQSTLKQLVRDWSAEGAAERAQCYTPILAALRQLFPGGEGEDRAGRRVLVPGAGLGRLAFEIAAEGFECQGNEFSLFMLFASNFVLNKTHAIDCFKIFPFMHNYCNNMDSRSELNVFRWAVFVCCNIRSMVLCSTSFPAIFLTPALQGPAAPCHLP
jgi:carnosine N-methyltransferase